jgi:osmotically-inducible protein OsmY
MFDYALVAEPSEEQASRRYCVVRSSMARDGDLAAAAQDRLESQAYRRVRSLSCSCHDGVLMLSGRVSSYHEKQLAQEAVKGLAGIRRVVNLVRVTVSNYS